MNVVIVGAGPYGLSVAAHLRAQGVEHRIFGVPMGGWQQNMPAGMFLKSDAPSSNLSEPDGRFTLTRFYAAAGEPYVSHAPVPRATFIDYGLAFQARFVPHVESEQVETIQVDDNGYSVRLSSGEIIHARSVVVAIGVEAFRYTPDLFATLPDELVSHSAAYGSVEALRGLDVAVIGSGASAVDIALSLADCGAKPVLVSRRSAIAFQIKPEPQTLLQKLRSPDSGIGGGWKLKVCAELPDVVHALPPRLRVRIVKNYLGPAPGWFMRDRVKEKVRTLSDHVPVDAGVAHGRVRLRFQGGQDDVLADHVVCATGYRTGVACVGFLDEALRARIDTTDTAPALSRHFESSVAGLYFVGPASAMSFGPVMRFVYGAAHAARRVAGHLAGASVRRVAGSPALVAS